MDELLDELKKAYGSDAEFREGQREATEGALEGRRSLVVQKTGWGKSLVYFLATKLIRKRNSTITIIISPLLALMDNQIDSAQKFGLNVGTINSTNKEDWDNVKTQIKNNELDAIIISPERLANMDFMTMLVKEVTMHIGLFVVDEAHCISDWGHDFRPDYRRIVSIVEKLPSNIPVLATTATANDRVVYDIIKQLGDDLCISRGSLMRESLEIQVIKLYSKEERLAWLSENIPNIDGTGLIYCLTVNDCILVKKWLEFNHIACASYYSDIEKKEGCKKEDIVNSFMKNEIKVLVATVAFGMGIDKPDISFVIHFQKPGNVVAYYQQIGRAGRAIDHAYAILMVGIEDDEINNYFIESAFPTEQSMNDVIKLIQSSNGMKESELENRLNMKKSKIEHCLKYLLVNGDIYCDNRKYYKTPKVWRPDIQRSQEVTKIRKKELEQMNEYIQTSECYMEFIAKVLNDSNAHPCGKCANCLQSDIINSYVAKENILQASKFIKEDFNIIEPRKMWPTGIRVDDKNKIPLDRVCDEGRVLSNYGDAGWGKDVMIGKYHDNYFSDELVNASVQLLREFIVQHNIVWLTNIPSLRRPELVTDFAKRLAQHLQLPYVDAIIKSKDTQCQKTLNNSHKQFGNADSSFEVCVENIKEGNVLLVDDMVDSRWTFTVCGYKLRKNGSGQVYPFALANTAGKDGDD